MSCNNYVYGQFYGRITVTNERCNMLNMNTLGPQSDNILDTHGKNRAQVELVTFNNELTTSKTLMLMKAM